ncbi:hypothetical protein N9D23_08055 [Rubripirellula sp.]|nr:hypothetical protein [Rubripirellula sp.]
MIEDWLRGAGSFGFAIKAIAACLPAAVDFKSVEGALLALGEESLLHLFSIQEGDRQVGQ